MKKLFSLLFSLSLVVVMTQSCNTTNKTIGSTTGGNTPSATKAATRDAASVNTPKVKKPSAPKVKRPSAPTVSTPKVKKPSAPSASKPKIKKPSAPSVSTPKVKKPSAPGMSKPGIPDMPAGLANLSPASALTGVQSLLGGTTTNVLKGFAGGNVLQNPIMQKSMPKGLSTITSLLGSSPDGTKALGLLNSAVGSAVPNVASGVFGDVMKNISPTDALGLMQGGTTGATDFLKRSSEQKLKAALLPAITKNLTNNGGLSLITAALGAKASGLVGGGKPSVADLVTTGAVDGLFNMMGNAEEAERANPTDPALKAIFGQ